MHLALMLLLLVASAPSWTQAPSLTATPARVTFIATSDRSVPLPQRVRLIGEGAAGVTWRAIPSAPWIRVNPVTGTGTAELTVSVDVARLSPGSHRGRVAINPTGATEGSGVVVDVTVQIVAPATAGSGTNPRTARLSPSEPKVGLSARVGATEGVGSTITLTGPDGAVAAWVSRVDQPWLTTSPSEGTTPSRVAVSASPQGLPVGVHHGSVTFLDESGEPVMTVPVTLTIGAWTDPLTVGAQMPTATRNLPYSQALPIKGGKPPYAIRVIQGRLPAGFTLANGALTGVARSPGSYGFVLGVTDSATPPATVQQPVSLRVIVLFQGTALQVSPPNVTLTTDASAHPISARINISSGVQSLEWQAAADVPWLVLKPSAGQSPATLQVDVNPAGLEPGVHLATLTITMDGVPNGPARIPVQLTIRK